MPSSMTHLSIQTGDGRRVVNAFLRQAEAPRGLLVCLPGQSYGADGPLLYYTKRLLQDSGWDTLGLTYGFQTAMDNLDAEAVTGCMAEARAAVLAGRAERDYPRLGLLGKSLGASVLAWLCRDAPDLESARAAFLTPLVGTPMFDAAFVESRMPAYVAIGTRDRFYDPAAIDRLRSQRAFQLRVIEGQDHSLDFDGELESSLKDLRTVVQDLVEFFDPPLTSEGKVRAA